jgi:hypothetical protein
MSAPPIRARVARWRRGIDRNVLCAIAAELARMTAGTVVDLKVRSLTIKKPACAERFGGQRSRS